MPYYPIRGGREEFVHRLATSLAERGHEVTLLAPVLPGFAPSMPQDSDAPFDVIRLPLGGIFVEDKPTDLQAAATVATSVLRERRPQVLHAHNLGPDLMVLRNAVAASGCPAPIALTAHGLASWMDTRRWSIARYAVRVVDALVAVSEVTHDEIALRAPVLHDRLVLIRNGVPIPHETTEVNPGSRDLLVMGRLSTEKGVAGLVVAFSVLAAERPGWRLVVAGDGQERAALERLARHLRIDDRIQFTGWLDQLAVRDRLRECLLAVVPSVWNEPFGLSAAEAHAAGRAVLASRVGALPEIVEDGRTGWLVPPGDPLALAGVLRSVADDPAVAVRCGIQARERARREFDWDRCVSSYEELYARIAKREGR
jgi:glycosyltransferase involved in cell wall biosynthesis